ncbi:hypothetical protein L8P27_21960 [Enterobacter asburiae]|uniref:hypothetical protein n=1 Tax=Enterobacter asburiae TaxID=61645 RepID=UPI002003E454|nr:hypothetical protein [Enterobacter asburiae]MCK7230463.1 hypothetical protein [Enterobacter asburiae]
MKITRNTLYSIMSNDNPMRVKRDIPETYDDFPIAWLYEDYFMKLGTPMNHGDQGVLATNLSDWKFKSMDHSERMAFHVSSEVDITSPATNYVGYCNSYNPETTNCLPLKYPFPLYPLQYLCIDKSLATLVKMSLASFFPDTGMVAVSAKSQVPGSSTMFNSVILANASPEGTGLGFIGTNSGDTTDIDLQIGMFDPATGTIGWTQSATLTLSWDGQQVSVVNSTLPLEWDLSNIVQLADGTWVINVMPFKSTWTAFEGENYTGVASGFLVDNSIIRVEIYPNSFGGWGISSLKLQSEDLPGRFHVYSEILTMSPEYSFNNYRMISSDESIPNLPELFGDGNLPCIVMWLNNTYPQLWLEISTTNPDYSAVVMETSPMSAENYFADKTRTGFVGIGAPGLQRSITVIYGYIDSTGSFIQRGQGTALVVYGEDKDQPPVMTNVSLPAEWVFSPATKQADALWKIALTDSPAL